MKALNLIIGFLICLSGCQVLNSKTDSPTLGNTNWKLIAINQKPVSLGDRAFITFDEKEQRAAGKAACNSFSGGYEQIRDNITFSDIISTKMYCEGLMDQEGQILTHLKDTRRFEVKSDMLYLYGSDELLLTFKR